MSTKEPVVVHVMHDEKFNDMAIRQFEDAGVCRNEYWVTCSQLSLTTSPLAVSCTDEELVRQINRNDVVAIIFHGLSASRYMLLDAIKSESRVIWIGWGFDYYDILTGGNDARLILPKTRRISGQPKVEMIKGHIKSLLTNVGLYSHRADSLARVDYFSPVLDVEFGMVRRCANLRAKYIEWNYGTAEDDLTAPSPKPATAKNILVGNSASATNNHIEVFELLSKSPLDKDSKIICPLSYGDMSYGQRVAERGRRILGERFVPLTGFLQKQHYLELLHSCGIVVMGHLRQQAVGNVCSALMMGATVYLDRRNPLHGWLASRGAEIGDLFNLDLRPLTESEQDINRKVVFRQWGRAEQLRKTTNLLSIAIGKGDQGMLAGLSLD